MYGYYIKNKIIFIILISFLFFSSKSYCKWEWVSGSSQLGSVDIYVDFERIVKKDDYTYFWYLMNWKEINNPYGNFSNIHSFFCCILYRGL